MRDLLGAANRRYLAFLSNLTDPSAGVQQVERLADPRRHDERSYRGFNLFSADDLALFTALARGEWQISGFRNASLRRVLPPLLRSAGLAPAQTLARAWPIKKIGHTDKYYLTHAGQRVVLTALTRRELVVIPSLAGLLSATA